MITTVGRPAIENSPAGVCQTSQSASAQGVYWAWFKGRPAPYHVCLGMQKWVETRDCSVLGVYLTRARPPRETQEGPGACRRESQEPALVVVHQLGLGSPLLAQGLWFTGLTIGIPETTQASSGLFPLLAIPCCLSVRMRMFVRAWDRDGHAHIGRELSSIW